MHSLTILNYGSLPSFIEDNLKEYYYKGTGNAYLNTKFSPQKIIIEMKKLKKKYTKFQKYLS